MSSFRGTLWLLVSVATVFVTHVRGWNYTLAVREDDRRVIDLGVFGYSENGVLELNLKTFDLVETEELATKDEKIGFVLDLVESATYARQERNYARNEEQKNAICFVNDKAVMPDLRYLIALEGPLADGKVKVSPKKKGGLKAKKEIEEKKKGDSATDGDDGDKKAAPKKNKKKSADADADGPDAPPPPSTKKKAASKKSKKGDDDGGDNPNQVARGFRALADDDAPPAAPKKKAKKAKPEDDDAGGETAAPKKTSKKTPAADDADGGDGGDGGAGGDDIAERSVYSVKVRVTRPGLYALFYYNCKRYYKDTLPVHTSFDVDIRQYNVFETAGSDKAVISYLGSGDTYVPLMYLVYAAFFFVGLAFWHKTLRDAVNSSQAAGQTVLSRVQLHKVHYFLYALAVLKILTLVLQGMMLEHRKNTGAMRGFIDGLFYVFQTLKGIALFTTIVLLGSGWSIVKPFLSDRDRYIILIILPLQILGNIALAIIDETSEGSADWTAWKNALRIFDVVCCCAVILPIAVTIQNFTVTAEGKSARDLHRMKQFRTFYLIVVAFVYWTRIVIPMAEGLVPYNLTWAPPFLYEAVALCFYAFLGVRFQPQSKESLLRAEAEAAEEAQSEDTPMVGRTSGEVLASRKPVDDGDVQVDDGPAAPAAAK